MPEQNTDRLQETIRWALDANAHPALASANWLAGEIDPDCNGVEELLARASVSPSTLRVAKRAFKTMRIMGETSADRRLGARLYAAAIASAIVHHQRLISAQSDAAMIRAFTGLAEDESMPMALRDLGRRALNSLDEMPAP